MSENRPQQQSEAMTSLQQVCAHFAATTAQHGGRQLAGDASPLTRNLLFTIHRQQIALDWQLQRLATGKIRPRLRHILHWAMAENYWLNALPAPVISDIAVSYTKRKCTAAESGFVNALLRHLWAEAPDLPALEQKLQAAPAAVRLRLPHKRVVRVFQKILKFDQMTKFFQTVPSFYLCLF